MKTKYINVPPNNKWGVIVVYDFDTRDDMVELIAIMRSFGMSLYNAKKALGILSNYNTGMAVSQDDLRMSAIFIGKATRPEQFWDSVNHELYHVNNAIIDYYNEPYDEEGAAYLQGWLMRQAVVSLGEPCY